MLRSLSKHAVDAGDTLQFGEIQQAGGWDFFYFILPQPFSAKPGRCQSGNLSRSVPSNYLFKLLIMCLLYTYFAPSV